MDWVKRLACMFIILDVVEIPFFFQNSYVLFIHLFLIFCNLFIFILIWQKHVTIHVPKVLEPQEKLANI